MTTFGCTSTIPWSWIWAFVHESTSGTVALDDLPLTFGETYPMDFFYCERQTVGLQHRPDHQSAGVAQGRQAGFELETGLW